MKVVIFLISLSFIFLTPAQAETPFSADANWHHADDLFIAFRSNAPHFWNWLRLQNSPLTTSVGVAVGDPHIENFGDVQLASGGREFTLIDIDDGGPQAPLVGDIVRYAAGNQVSLFQISLTDIFNAYMLGLQGQSQAAPSVLRDALSRSDADFFKSQDKYMSKLTNGDHFSSKAKLTSIANSPSSVQDLYQSTHVTFESNMSGYRLLDVGYKTKANGGSQGLPRFWYLIEKNQTRYIVEFKLETVAATSFFSPQGDPVQRFAAIAQIYRPLAAPYGPYKVIATPAGQFLMRARVASFLNFDPDNGDDSTDDGKSMSLYIANRLGLWHGQQAGGKTLQATLKFADLQKLVTDYVNLMTEENSK